MSTCLYNGFDWHMAFPAGADMFDFTLENSYAIQTLVPQRSYRHTYSAPGCEFDLTFHADRPPVAMQSSGESVNVGMRDFVQNVESQATGHYEQTGVIAGTLLIEGERIEVSDAAVIKDRTWGPRRILIGQRKPRGSYTFARANRDNAFQAFAMSAQTVGGRSVGGSRGSGSARLLCERWSDRPSGRWYAHGARTAAGRTAGARGDRCCR